MVAFWWLCGCEAVVRRNESEMKADFSGLPIALQTPLPAPKAIVREDSPFSPTYALAFGAAALVRALAFLQRARLGLPTPRGPLRAARPLAALRVRALRSDNPTPTARANLAVPSAPSLRFAPAHFAKGHRARGVPVYPNLGVGLWRGGVGSCVRVPPTSEIGTPTPAPD